MGTGATRTEREAAPTALSLHGQAESALYFFLSYSGSYADHLDLVFNVKLRSLSRGEVPSRVLIPLGYLHQLFS